MKTLKQISDWLRGWLVAAIREGTKPVDQKPPTSGHVKLMRLAAARALIPDVGMDQAARAVGVEREELRRWLAHQRSPVSARIRRPVG